ARHRGLETAPPSSGPRAAGKRTRPPFSATISDLVQSLRITIVVRKTLNLVTLAASASLLAACSEQAPPPPEAPDTPQAPAEAAAPAAAESPSAPESEEAMADNPLLVESELPYGMPAFDKIESEHFLPAFDAAMKEHLEEVDAIAGSDEEPTFDNTILALERSGRKLGSIARVFSNLTSTVIDDTLKDTQRKMAPKFS